MAHQEKPLAPWFERVLAQLPPRVQQFIRTLLDDWLACMSGTFSVPFAAFGAFSLFGTQALWVACAMMALIFCGYRIWSREYDKVLKYEEAMRPKLDCVFDPDDAGCIRPNTTINIPVLMSHAPTALQQIDSTYFRIRASTSNFATVSGCRARLTRVSRNGTIVMQGENIILPFAHKGDGADVRDGVPEYIDLIAITANNEVRIASQGLIVPSSIRQDQLFDLPGSYVFHVIITCNDGPPTVVEPALNWTAERATATLHA